MSQSPPIIHPQPTPAPQPQSPPVVQSASSITQLRADINVLLGLIRDIRAEAQNIQDMLQEIKKKGELLDPKMREQEIKAAMLASDPIFVNNCAQITALFAELRRLLARNPEIYARHGDDVTYIENAWERVLHRFPVSGLSVDQILQRAGDVAKQLGILICRSGLLTIPERVNRHMAQLRVGRTLNFHDTFKDELPVDEDRLMVLRYMHTHPLAVNGVVDVEQGIIYSVSAKPWRRILSFLPVVVFPILGAFLFRFIDSADLIAEPANSYSLAGYSALIGGGYLHVIVDALKQARAEKGQSLLAIEDWLLWFHVKELAIIVGLVSLLFGYAGLSYFLKKPAEVSTAFFIGYSIDSFIDLFLARFSKTVTASTESIKRSV